MKIEYGWYPNYNIWAVYAVDSKGVTKEFEYAGNIETAKFIIRNYCKKYNTHNIIRICSKMEENNGRIQD